MMLRLCLVVAPLLLLAALPGSAHELRPSLLEVREIQTGSYDVLWKRPALGTRTLALTLRWPAACHEPMRGQAELLPGATLERRLLACGPEGLLGQRIAIDGLSSTLTDTLVRVELLDGTTQLSLVKPAQPWVDVEGPRPAAETAAAYFVLGVEHILLGLDHLLFVLGLTLIVRGPVMLVKTVTAFTVAHSITLGLATLGYVALPPAPVEAVIALSIVFVAVELIRQGRREPGLTERAPWLVAFAFGLLHGFGFAGALSEIGLPRTDIPLALLSFNAGVEAGQLLFVAAVLGVIAARNGVVRAPPVWLGRAAAYAIGPLAAFWVIERMADLV